MPAGNNWELIPNARFPLSHTHVLSRAILHSTATPSDPLCCVPCVESWVDDRRCPPGKPPCAFLAVALHLIPLATSSRFGEIPGGKGCGDNGSRFLYLTGVPIPRGLAAAAGLANYFLPLREPRRRQHADSFRSWLIGTDCESMRGASEDHVPCPCVCFVQPEHHCRRRRALPGPGQPSIMSMCQRRRWRLGASICSSPSLESPIWAVSPWRW